MTISTNYAIRLGELMCAVTQEVLWSPAQNWVRKQAPATTLLCRVGSGQATYHRFDPRLKQHQITYGKRMIMSKHQPDAVAGWLSGREIRQRKYFEGEVTTLNLLAHTCCHEFAHLLQHVAGQRYHGSVHNPHFYRILDELHDSGGADAAKRHLAEQAERAGIPLPHEPIQSTDTRQLMAKWSVGDSVGFGTSTRHMQGTIIRVNRKTCTVEGTGPCRGLRYRVPAVLLHPLAD
ncbi:hypothetical protein QPM17_16935 [Marinobacter sp. TBZ242]|uniref:SprT-like family protein n=1 Tax=Marinobacter azerbaijanicus TaxID=3050455 RepID=A0ABT7IFA0_9GAMM|nr:hypothetical protein [Marinobacter sp. TBZ242]MDL0432831.1 hypothetical protein [Marinobacter sp. TBZ242]